jgi:hypothetical protein
VGARAHEVVLPKSSDVRDHDNKQGFAGLRDSVQELTELLEPQRNRESALRREKAPEEEPDWATARSGPEEWAATHLKLGVAYRERLAGNRSKNREGAIACFKNAPSAWTRERNPKELAAAHPRDSVPGALRRVAGEPSIQWRQGSAAPANALPTRLAEPVGDHAGTTPVLEGRF